MSLITMNETVEKINKMGDIISEKEKKFIIHFAFKTGNANLIDELIAEIVERKKGVDTIITKYSKMMDIKPQWIGQIENLLIALEMYRIEEEKAMNRLSSILNAYGINISIDDIRNKDTSEIKEKVHKEAVM